MQHMRAGRNQYAPMQGAAVLREKIAEKVYRLYHAEYDPDSEVTITSGATEAIFDAITAVVHPGDEVIVFEPAYDSYVPAIQLCAGVPVFVKLHHPDYHINWDEVAEAVNSKTRLIILNSPHNPTGAVLTGKDIAALIAIVRNTDIFILSDEVYEHIIFDGRVHESMCRHPELFQRSFVVCSFGKMVHATGWKTGYCLAPKDPFAGISKNSSVCHLCIQYPRSICPGGLHFSAGCLFGACPPFIRTNGIFFDP